MQKLHKKELTIMISNINGVNSAQQVYSVKNTESKPRKFHVSLNRYPKSLQ